jgi:hypothetical protein
MFVSSLILGIFVFILILFIIRTSTLTKNVEILQDCVHDCVPRDELQTLIAKYLASAMQSMQNQ